VELKGIPKALLDERGQGGKCLKCGKDGHNWYECWSKQPVIGKVAGNKRKAGEEPKEEGGRASKNSKPSTVSLEVKKAKSPLAGITVSAESNIELSDNDMDNIGDDLDIWDN